jgi:hypothetical protein
MKNCNSNDNARVLQEHHRLAPFVFLLLILLVAATPATPLHAQHASTSAHAGCPPPNEIGPSGHIRHEDMLMAFAAKQVAILSADSGLGDVSQFWAIGGLHLTVVCEPPSGLDNDSDADHESERNGTRDGVLVETRDRRTAYAVLAMLYGSGLPLTRSGSCDADSLGAALQRKAWKSKVAFATTRRMTASCNEVALETDVWSVWDVRYSVTTSMRFLDGLTVGEIFVKVASNDRSAE